MTHETVHKAKSNGQATPAKIRAFERHLLQNGKPGRMRVDGGAQQRLIRRNIQESPAEGRFSAPVKVAVLRNLHSPADPEKSLQALVAIGRIARDSDEAVWAFMMAARTWRADATLKATRPDVWQQGESYIRHTYRGFFKDAEAVLAPARLVTEASPQQRF
ncbi:MAG: hypothetical protein PHQ80_03245 [Candidatus ainarchaeum sp.]|nr:hypothetical protein [Candidatus ainarchaeum sp.]MDD5096579.1 hypothetical protein [Candidatus ainarchaeum sp.]